MRNANTSPPSYQEEGAVINSSDRLLGSASKFPMAGSLYIHSIYSQFFSLLLL